jgi:hypothetical protein
MTPGRGKIHALVAVLVCATGAGCAPTRPPVDELAAASRALAVARQAGAEQLAAAEFRVASSHLDQARSAERDQDYDTAVQLAAESQVDSELAQARARLVKARGEVERIARENEGMERDLGASTTQEQQP